MVVVESAAQRAGRCDAKTWPSDPARAVVWQRLMSWVVKPDSPYWLFSGIHCLARRPGVALAMRRDVTYLRKRWRDSWAGGNKPLNMSVIVTKRPMAADSPCGLASSTIKSERRYHSA